MVLTTTIDAARAFAHLQDQLEAGRKLPPVLVLIDDKRIYRVDVAMMLKEMQPADAARFMFEETEKALRALDEVKFGPASLKMFEQLDAEDGLPPCCPRCEVADAVERGNLCENYCDDCYAAVVEKGEAP